MQGSELSCVMLENMADVGMANGEIVTNHLLDGRLSLAQPKRGHRAGTDAVLLARAIGDQGAAHIVDLGAGVGTVGMIAALFAPAAHITLVEIDPAMAALAMANAEANGMAERVRTIVADVLCPRRADFGLEDGCADIVLTNPPFLTQGNSRTSPDPQRARAHVMAEGDLALWLRRASAILKPKGRIVIIHRADALPDVLACLGQSAGQGIGQATGRGGMGEVRVLPVHAKANDAAIRILVTARKSSRAPFALLPPLILQDNDGRFTPLAESLHRGAAAAPLMF
jgi:tRNA1(Val) A37 N6-methylase TrmN6